MFQSKVAAKSYTQFDFVGKWTHTISKYELRYFESF